MDPRNECMFENCRECQKREEIYHGIQSLFKGNKDPLKIDQWPNSFRIYENPLDKRILIISKHTLHIKINSKKKKFKHNWLFKHGDLGKWKEMVFQRVEKY